MRLLKIIPLFIMVLALSSCYHAQVVTDAKPSDQVIDKPWASSFVFGLVPPEIVTTASTCPNGVAKVETEISFLNGLVSAITFNIYTPMHIKVTCAAGSGMSSLGTPSEREITISKKSTGKQIIQTIQEASERAAKTGEPVFVQFR